MTVFEKGIIERTTLGKAEDAVTEAITLTTDHREKGQITTIRVEGSENIFAQVSVNMGPAILFCHIPGSPLLQDGFALTSQALSRLARRGWKLAGSKHNPLEKYHSRHWEGVTTEIGRRHVAEEVLSVLTDIYQLDPSRNTVVSVNFDLSQLE